MPNLQNILQTKIKTISFNEFNWIRTLRYTQIFGGALVCMFVLNLCCRKMTFFHALIFHFTNHLWVKRDREKGKINVMWEQPNKSSFVLSSFHLFSFRFESYITLFCIRLSKIFQSRTALDSWRKACNRRKTTVIIYLVNGNVMLWHKKYKRFILVAFIHAWASTQALYPFSKASHVPCVFICWI